MWGRPEASVRLLSSYLSATRVWPSSSRRIDSCPLRVILHSPHGLPPAEGRLVHPVSKLHAHTAYSERTDKIICSFASGESINVVNNVLCPSASYSLSFSPRDCDFSHVYFRLRSRHCLRPCRCPPGSRCLPVRSNGCVHLTLRIRHASLILPMPSTAVGTEQVSFLAIISDIPTLRSCVIALRDVGRELGPILLRLLDGHKLRSHRTERGHREPQPGMEALC